MSSVAKVKVDWDDREVKGIEYRAIKGLVRMGFDVASRARRNAPYVTGALRNTIRVNQVSPTIVEIVAGGNFGGFKVDYAWIREQGPNRNKATEHYMEKAKDSVCTGDYVGKYLGNIV